MAVDWELATITGADRLSVRVAIARMTGVLELDFASDIATINILYAEIKTIRVANYAVAGDYGDAVYDRRSSAPTATTNPGFRKTADNVWFQLRTSDLGVKLEHFGARNNYVSGLATTAGRLAILAAQEFAYEVTGNRALTVRASGDYGVDATTTISKRIRLLGQQVNMGVDGYAPTTFHFTNTTGSYFFITGGQGPGEDDNYNFGTITRGYAAILEGFTISGPAAPTALYHGNWAAVRCRTTPYLRNLQFASIPIHAIHIHGSTGSGSSYPMEGNCNDWVVDHCRVYSSGCDGLRVWGIDCNGGLSNHFVTHQGVLGCGINDRCSLGSTHIQPQITGYGDWGIHYAGKLYQYIDGNPATVPGTNNAVWYYLRDGVVAANYPEWNAASADQATFRGPIYISNQLSVLVGPYVEGAGILSYSNSAAIIGGVAPWTTNSANRAGPQTTAYFGSIPTSQAFARFGNGIGMSFGGAREITGVRNGTYNDGANVATWTIDTIPEGEICHLGGKMQWNHGGVTVFETTTNYTAETYGTTIPQKNKAALPNGVYIGNIFIGTCLGGPPTAVGYYPLKSMFIREDATAGDPKFYKTTTPGAIADQAWVSTPGGFGRGTIVSTSSGRFYLLDQFSASTVEPSHTTTGAAVTLADGARWWYLGVSTAPLFTGVS
jgi:hypothetical protein